MNQRRKQLFTCLVTILLTCIPCFGNEDWDCFQPCKCKWVSGKKTADCIRQDLTNIPDTLSSEIQNLDLTGNHITQIHHNAFSEVNLVNLHKLVLRECSIEAIHTDAFNGLRIVIEIDLSGNNIKQLYPGTFVETLRLRVLLLNNNNLEILENGLFHNLVYLQKIVLSNNQLKRIEDKTFRNLSGLQTLNLDGNDLTSVRFQTFASETANLTKLGSLELHNNPWNCNCHLKKFRDWTIERKLYTKPTTCTQPATLAGKMWDEVNSDDFACIPKILTIGPTSRLEITGGDDAKLWCRAVGVPRPRMFWVHRSRVLSNITTRRRSGTERTYIENYILREGNGWVNLTIPSITGSDRGDYVCVAENPGGTAEKNLTLIVVGELFGGKDSSSLSLPLAIGIGVTVVLLLLLALAGVLYYCRRRKTRHDEKSTDTTVSMEHHGLNEQEKSLITSINPVVKPSSRRYETPSSVTSHGTEMTELNRTLLDNDSIFADGVASSGGGGIVVGSIDNGIGDEEREESIHTPELDNGTLMRGSISYRQYPPDLLAFSGGRGASPTSQASTAPDNSRLPNQLPTSAFSSPSSQYPTIFKTLPHNRSMTPYATGSAPVMPRHGYVTIPRRPRAPSWSSGPPTSPTTTEILEPVYDNLGLRTTADGSSVLSLNKSPEPVTAVRNRPLPITPVSLYSDKKVYGTIQRSSSNNLSTSPVDRAAPEGAAEWPLKLSDELDDHREIQHPQPQYQQVTPNSTLSRKVPPRPPPKPKKKTANGPLYEDEGEDGTEV